MEKTTSSSEVDELLEFSYLYDFYGNRLKEYEDKLCLVDKFQRTKDKLQQIEEIAGESQDVEGAQAISALAEQIYEMI